LFREHGLNRDFLIGHPTVQNIHVFGLGRAVRPQFLAWVVPAARHHASAAPEKAIPELLQWVSLDTLPSLEASGSLSLVPKPELSRRNRQPSYPPQHAGKQPSRQMTLLRREQPIMAGMLDRSTTCFLQEFSLMIWSLAQTGKLLNLPHFARTPASASPVAAQM